MKTIKFIDSKTINIKEETITQKIRSKTWKGHTIGNIPNEFYSYFNYKGLTYIQE